MVTLRARFNPLSALAIVLVVGGVYSLMRDRIPSGAVAPPCDPSESICEDEPTFGFATGMATAGPTLEASEACLNVGYLCADLLQQDRIRIRRWKDFTGTMVVHVPRPDFEDAAAAIELQRAAIAGLRTWSNQPFPILIDQRGDRDPHFAIRWRSSLGGTQLGEARTQWSASSGLTVISLELATRSPFNGQVIAARQIRLTAAHEMGHALGLGHSDSPRDVMYPTNTATSVSAQDRRTLEVLYQMEDGTEIVR